MIGLLVGATIGTNTASAEVIGDQHWITPVDSSPNYHSIVYQDEVTAISTFPRLTAERYSSDPTVWSRFLCSSTSDAHCQNVSQFSYQALFPVCQVASDVDCIEGLTATSDSGQSQDAKFLSYTVPNHVNKFLPDASLGIPKTETPSLWDLPSAPHAFGSQYVAVVGQAGSVKVGEYGNSTQSQLFGYLVPVSKIDARDLRNQSPLNVSYDSVWETKGATGQSNTGGYAVSTDGCTMSLAETGKCLTSHGFPDGFKYSLKIRLAKEPVAWLHGRMVDPSISISPLNGAVEMTVTASSTKVPTFSLGIDSSQLSLDQEGIWVACFTNGTVCSAGGTKGGPAIDNYRTFTADYSKTLNLWINMYGYGATAIEGIRLLAPLVEDKSQALPSAWSFHTLPTTQLENADSCFATGPGLKGIVTTNSTAYSEGPPAFKDGSLQYTVASAHYNPDGSVFKGTYNLVMRSDVARCLYKFTSAPISASIEVVSQNGSQQVATTAISEKDGWLHLAANGFTYSSPSIRIRLNQSVSAAVPTPSPVVSPAPKTAAPKVSVTKSITCVKGKSVKKITGANPKCPAGYKKKTV